jgi:hypothetical protein
LFLLIKTANKTFGGCGVRKAIKAIVTALLFSALSLSAAKFVSAQDSQTDTAIAADIIPPARAKSIIAGRAREAVTALKNRDMQRLSDLVHPNKGVRFTPYNYVEPKQDLVFHRGQIKSLMSSRKRYLWGDYDAGDRIRLTFKGYYKRFIYDWNFANAKEINYSREAKDISDYDNAYKSYPGAIIVEYFNPGTVESGMDWSTLRLVFEKKNRTWFLVGIIHNEWTI